MRTRSSLEYTIPRRRTLSYVELDTYKMAILSIWIRFQWPDDRSYVPSNFQAPPGRNEMNEMKNMMKAFVPTPVPVKAVEEREFQTQLLEEASFAKLDKIEITSQEKLFILRKASIIAISDTSFPTIKLRTLSKWGNKYLILFPNKELNKEILIPIPRESKIGKDCDFPSCDDFQSFKTFSNPLFEKQDDFPSRNDESILKEEVHEEAFKSYLNPLFEDDEEIISNEVGKDNVEVSHEVFKSNNENDLGIHDENEVVNFLPEMDTLEDENFFEMNDKKVESFDSKTKEVFETKVEPEKKKELQVFHPDIG
ncbi:hypothetical protein Tco_0807271 [Tanacetum coccineum]